MSTTKRRGFDPEDTKWFTEESIAKLRIAQEDIQWLLDRDYKLDSIIELVGNHYLLSARQRTALKRGTSPTLHYKKRQSTMLPYDAAKDGCLYIDGFNLIIIIEVALSHSVLILCRDNVLRDLAGLRGSYKLIDQTDSALKIIGLTLNKLHVPKVKFYLDSPVSNSGRLKSKILQHSTDWNIPTEVELVQNPDVLLSRMDRVITGDSIILDECKSWFNLSLKIIEDYIENPWIVDLSRST